MLASFVHRIIEPVRSWCVDHLDAFFDRRWAERSAPDKIAAALAALTFLTAREAVRDRSPMMAAGLAFFTVLAVVPLLTVGASLISAFGLLEEEGSRLFEPLEQLFPDVASGLANYLGDVAIDSAQALGGIGAATLLVIGIVLFHYIEETLTEIWGGSDDRSFVVKMLTFWTMLTFGPVLIALSIVQSARAQLFLTEIGLDISIVAHIAPLLSALAAFTLLIKLMPNAKVTWRAALVGGLFTAVVFELAKWGFNVYVNQLLLQTYDRVYGALALIPIGLLWMYITWLVILVGAELAYSFQHMRQLLRAEAGRRSRKAGPEKLQTLHPMVSVEVLAAMLQAYQRGEGPIDKDAIGEHTQLPSYLIDPVLELLRERDLIVEVGDDMTRRWLPARAGDSIELADLIEAFWPARPVGRPEEIEELSEAYLTASREFFDNYDGADLVDHGADS